MVEGYLSLFPLALLASRCPIFLIACLVLTRVDGLVVGGVFFVSLLFVLGSSTSSSGEQSDTSEFEAEDAGIVNFMPFAFGIPPGLLPC